MKSWLLTQFGSLDHLRLADDAAVPTPGPGEALLKVEYAALNPADRYLALGQYPARPPLPHVLGRDAIGTVVAVADDVKTIRLGERRLLLRSEIGVSRPGAFAQLCAIPVESLVVPPADWSPQQCAAAPLVYLTAWQALTAWGDLSPGIVLVTGASGGVGVASIQLARAMLHRVIALSRSHAKADKLRAHGAHLVLNPDDPDWPKTLKEHLTGRRVDLAIDNIAGPGFNRLLETLGEHGRVSCVGALAGPVPDFNTASLFFRRLRVGGISVGAYTAAQSRAAWGKLLALLEETAARPLVDSVWPFDQLHQAFARLAEGPMGKVLLKIAGD
ncbi:MAG TPA: zinc-binding alcohol dehydrogenase family protein [Tepidisphaeraceae bacterium]|jgi:NADPH2:quinone reductase